MQKRFTAKDGMLFGLLGLIFLVLLLTMYMIDRQWLRLSEIEKQVNEQSTDLRVLRQSLRELDTRAVNARPVTRNGELPDSFKRAHQASQATDYAEGDWLVRSFSSGIKTLTPLISTDAYATEIQNMVLETLLIYDPDSLELIGHIATSWKISDDGLVITYKMRDDVTFSDGQKLTAHDLVFTYDFIMNEKVDAPRHRAYYKKIKSVVALDDYTVQFTFTEPYYNSLLLSGSLEILPKHFYSQYMDDPTPFNQSKGILLGSGPYRLKAPDSWTPDKKIVELIRNDRYWGPVTPSYDRVMWKIIDNDSARLTTFRNRELDIYSARPIEYKKLLNDKDLTSRTQHFEYMPPINGYIYIAWNHQRKGKDTLFTDKRVREALTYLTDRQKMIDEILLGYGEIAVSPFNPQSKQHNPALTPRQPDVDKAIALLKQAGFEDRDGDGVIENEKGEKFQFDLLFPNVSEDAKRLVLLLKDFYAKAGIQLTPKAAEWPVMLEKGDTQEFDAMILGWTSVVESDLYQIFHSSQIDDNGDNYISYRNPKLDKLIEQARTTVDRDKRMALWHQCEKLLYEDQPYTFLYRRAALVFVDDRIQNLKVTNFGLNHARTPVETFVPVAQQKY